LHVKAGRAAGLTSRPFLLLSEERQYRELLDIWMRKAVGTETVLGWLLRHRKLRKITDRYACPAVGMTAGDCQTNRSTGCQVLLRWGISLLSPTRVGWR